MREKRGRERERDGFYCRNVSFFLLCVLSLAAFSDGVRLLMEHNGALFGCPKKKIDSGDCTTVATQPRQLHYSNNLSKKIVFVLRETYFPFLFIDFFCSFFFVLCCSTKGTNTYCCFGSFCDPLFSFVFWGVKRYVQGCVQRHTADTLG